MVKSDYHVDTNMWPSLLCHFFFVRKKLTRKRKLINIFIMNDRGYTFQSEQ